MAIKLISMTDFARNSTKTMELFKTHKKLYVKLKDGTLLEVKKVEEEK